MKRYSRSMPLLAAVAFASFAAGAHAELAAPSPALTSLQAAQQGGAAAYQSLSDGSVTQPGATVAAIPASAPVVAVAPCPPGQQVAPGYTPGYVPVPGYVPAPSVDHGHDYRRSHETHRHAQTQSSGGLLNGMPLIGAVGGGAVGYLLSTAFCLSPWAIAGFVVIGALAGAGAQKAFFG